MLSRLSGIPPGRGRAHTDPPCHNLDIRLTLGLGDVATERWTDCRNVCFTELQIMRSIATGISQCILQRHQCQSRTCSNHLVISNPRTMPAPFSRPLQAHLYFLGFRATHGSQIAIRPHTRTTEGSSRVGPCPLRCFWCMDLFGPRHRALNFVRPSHQTRMFPCSAVRDKFRGQSRRLQCQSVFPASQGRSVLACSGSGVSHGLSAR